MRRTTLQERIALARGLRQKEKMELQTEEQKVIEGVEKLQWGKGRDNTFMGALTAAMRVPRKGGDLR